MLEKNNKNRKYLIGVIVALAILGLGSGSYFYKQTILEVTQNTIDLEEKILELENKNIALTIILKEEQKKNGIFETQIGEIAGTVGKLDKLSKTDKELLQKYSKIYFLNEHYIPENLTDIPKNYLYDENREMKMHIKAYPFLRGLLEEADSRGIDLKIISAYRSFGEQNSLKTGYSLVYGSGANRFSADQGYSEHQLGTTIDFTTSKIGNNFNAFESTESFKWLKENAYKYGFILSYPQNNSYYQYEPWHWRFVGVNLAKRLNEEEQNFYDLDQRIIDNYLISIFD